MGTDQDRARVRSRLAAASTMPAPTRPGVRDAADPVDDDDTPTWAPGWLSDQDDSPDEPDGLRDSSRRWATRLNVGRRGAAALVVVGVVAAGVAAVSVWRDRPTARAVPPLPVVEVQEQEPGAGAGDRLVPPSAQLAPPGPDAPLVVSVVGLVNQAGLVRLPPGSRIADALAAAGGPRPGADVLGLNMAEKVDDGDQILVGVTPPDGGPTTVGSARVGAGTAVSGGAAGAPAKGVGKVDLNTAAEADLDALPGVGPVTAAAIVAWRQTNGKFTDVEQLGEVDGIGPARLAKLRDLVTL
ncbi:ComEA family DNA-binding protein [Prescottella agglutinans]|uniref:ComEA family DNA-binding protein n=1 Tax=Prescottella agglutinans TaxID=1644129 RepID=A0A3S3AIQ7_9NOCA|nr:ComEA family DNA-binding protein [Prescottella agglutinans]RVW11039.1 ComEA family DNA-binding protein [Prescottella agglutinans]